MNSSQQEQQRQQQPEVNNTDERQPLLSRAIQHTLSWTTSRLEADQVDAEIQNAQSRREEEDEAQWFAELRRKPWHLRPSSYWLILWSFFCGGVTGLCFNTVQQLRTQVICKGLLSNPTIHVSPETLILAPIDECMTPTAISMVRQVESRITVISSICLLLTLAKWCSLSDVYGRKLLLHIGLAGMAIFIMINWFAASRYNFAGYYLYYLQGLSFAFFPAGAVLNPGIFAYIADCTPKGQRGLAMGYIVVALGVGSVTGGSVADYIIDKTGDRTAVLRIPLILIALLAIYLKYVPESLRRKPAPLTFLVSDRSDSGHEAEDNTTPSTFWIIVAFFKQGTSMMLDPVLAILPGRIPVSANMATSATPLMILSVHFLVSMADYGYSRLFASMTSLVFHWDITEHERHDTFVTICMIVVLLGLLPIWNAAYKGFFANDAVDPAADSNYHSPQHGSAHQLVGLEAIKMDLFFSICSLFCVFLSYLLIPLFPSSIMIYFAGGLMSVGAISLVSIISVLSSVVPNHLFGAVYGADSICQQLSGAVVGLTYEPLFMKTKATMPLFYFYVSAALLALALLVQTINRLLYHTQ